MAEPVRAVSEPLMVPNSLNRLVTVVGAIVMLVVTAGTTTVPGVGLVLGPVMAWLSALTLAAGVTRGAWLRADVLEFRMLLSTRRVPTSQITKIHMGRYVSGLAVETHNGCFWMGERSGVSGDKLDAERAAVIRLGEDVGCEVVEYQDPLSYVDATRHATPAGLTAKGVVVAATRPLVLLVLLFYVPVWISVLVGQT